MPINRSERGRPHIPLIPPSYAPTPVRLQNATRTQRTCFLIVPLSPSQLPNDLSLSKCDSFPLNFFYETSRSKLLHPDSAFQEAYCRLTERQPPTRSSFATFSQRSPITVHFPARFPFPHMSSAPIYVILSCHVRLQQPPAHTFRNAALAHPILFVHSFPCYAKRRRFLRGFFSKPQTVLQTYASFAA